MRKTVSFLWSLTFVIFLFSLTGCDFLNADTPFKSSQLGSYVIVYSEENPDYFELANKLSDQIYAKYGVMLNTMPDAAVNPSKYEILIGDTNRYDPQGNVMEYSVTIDEGRFRINVGGSFSADKAVDFLCKNIFNGKELNLANGEYYRKSLLTKAYPLAENTTARIMTANILADAFADSSYKKAYYRAEIFAGMLIAYTPDVVGLQETDENWNKIFDDYLTKIQKTHGITYARHFATYESKVNYTSLLYRADKFKVADSGVKIFSWWIDPAFHHNYHMRNISWAQLSTLDEDKQFIVANTHWSYRTEHADNKTYLAGADKPIVADELRQQCKSETNAFMTELKNTYADIPIFLTGDFNTSLSFFTQSGWTPTSFKIISEEAKSSGKTTSVVPASGHYDHIFGTGKYTINQYAYFKNTDYLDLLTDHPFAYTDLAF